MAMKPVETVDAYLAAQPEAARAILARVRATIRKAMPNAEERISYNIPAYRLNNRNVLYFAGFKEHFSIYPIGAELLEAMGDGIKPYIASKGTLRFSLTKKPPLSLIRRIAQFRHSISR